MSRPLTFDIITIQNTSWDKTLEYWRTVESLGFDNLWIADHFVNPRRPQAPWLEAWSLLAALAVQTSRIRIGTLVTPIGLRHPAILARQAMTVDNISGGRLELGLGTGSESDPSWRMLGTGVWGPGERVRRFREYVGMVDSLLCNESTTVSGEYYQLDEAAMLPGCVQKPRPPLTIAARGRAMIAVTARYADRWNTFLGTSPTPEEAVRTIRERNVMLDEACTQIGRDPHEITRSLLLLDKDIPGGPFSSSDGFEEMVSRFREAGITDFIFYYPPDEWYPAGGKGQEEVFRRVAHDVMPRLRQS